ncbi:hypothetical protein F511_38406 [Dorcoceras hygrometricum]|uniref:Uncharacterized protein n=1 Tax=Dorcoceras hygrometricum TaxID=472368 RepID=A0A2Z7BIU1_9LAMI|nr:hypothetical protein F511_38406 [Dorcoceras hygrometricum]
MIHVSRYDLGAFKKKGKAVIGYDRPESSNSGWLKNRLDKEKTKAGSKSFVQNQQRRGSKKVKSEWKKVRPRRDLNGQNTKPKLNRSHSTYARTLMDYHTGKAVKAPGSDQFHRGTGTSTVGGGRSPNPLHNWKQNSFVIGTSPITASGDGRHGAAARGGGGREGGEGKGAALCSRVWDTASRRPTTIVTPKSQFRTDPSDQGKAPSNIAP